MLVLSRKENESIVIGDGITVIVSRIAGNRVTLGIEAPKDMRIVRGELKRFVEAFNAGQPSEEPGSEPEVSMVAFDRHSSPNFVPRLAR